MSEHERFLHPHITDPMPGRLNKPRSRGKTMVIDRGLGLHGLEDLLNTAAAYVDSIKFGFGTSTLYPRETTRKKIALCTAHGVDSCPGGTLTEIAIVQGKFQAFLQSCLQIGYTTIEISDGTYALPQEQRLRCIEKAAKQFHVVTEVGKKLTAFPDTKIAATLITEDLNAGSQMVVIEGRESGENAGIYGAHGEFKDELLESLVKHLPQRTLEKIMWEAPKKSQQLALIARFGNNVNLGNIAPEDVIAVESLRRGLRADTLAWTLRGE